MVGGAKWDAGESDPARLSDGEHDGVVGRPHRVAQPERDADGLRRWRPVDERDQGVYGTKITSVTARGAGSNLKEKGLTSGATSPDDALVPTALIRGQ